MNLRIDRPIVFPDLSCLENEDDPCPLEPAIVSQRDISALALQYQANIRANSMESSSSCWLGYLNELIAVYQELGLSVLIESEKLEGT